MYTDAFARLELDADFPSGSYTGIFEFSPADEGTLGANQQLTTGRLLDSSFDQVNGIISGLISDGESGRAGFSVDAGGGQHAITLEGQLPGERKKDDGSLYQWGSSGNAADGPNLHTATGAGRRAQQQTFFEYLRRGTADSVNPGRLYYGYWGDEQPPLDVAVENPSIELGNARARPRDLSITLVEIADIADVYDASKQGER